MFSALQLFNLAILAIVALAASRMEGIRGFRYPPVLLAAAVVGVCFAMWLGLTFGMNLHPLDARHRRSCGDSGHQAVTGLSTVQPVLGLRARMAIGVHRCVRRRSVGIRSRRDAIQS